VYYNVGSLASSCKACLYPTMSLLNVCKKEKEIYKTNICIGADDYCSTNYEGFSKYTRVSKCKDDLDSQELISCRWISNKQNVMFLLFLLKYLYFIS
jgi:hypothetical protein